MKVIEMTLFILMPMSVLVSKSLATARMAMPILVWLMSSTSSTTSMSAMLAAAASPSWRLRAPSRSQTGSVAERWFRERSTWENPSTPNAIVQPSS